MFDAFFSNLTAFGGFFATALVLLALFCRLYLWVTPYDELSLIRAGNRAAALSLGGAMLGSALPIAVAVAVSHSIVLTLAWGLVACVVQLLAYVLSRLALPELNRNISQGRDASGIFMAALSVSIGILNAGCLA